MVQSTGGWTSWQSAAGWIERLNHRERTFRTSLMSQAQSLSGVQRPSPSWRWQDAWKRTLSRTAKSPNRTHPPILTRVILA